MTFESSSWIYIKGLLIPLPNLRVRLRSSSNPNASNSSNPKVWLSWFRSIQEVSHSWPRLNPHPFCLHDGAGWCRLHTLWWTIQIQHPTVLLWVPGTCCLTLSRLCIYSCLARLCWSNCQIYKSEEVCHPRTTTS